MGMNENRGLIGQGCRVLFGALLLLPAAVVPSLPAAAAQAPGAEAARNAVSALGRLEPEHGIIRIAQPAMVGVTSGVVLKELLVEEGDEVVEGQLLAVTELAELMEAVVKEAEAKLELANREAEAAQSMAEGTCTLADARRREAARREHWRQSNVATEEEAERAEAEAVATAASCTAQRAEAIAAVSRIRVAEASLMRARTDLARTYIRAPGSGRILEVLTRPGELITPRGALEMGRVDRMYAIAEVYETDIRHVRVGQQAIISSAALESDITGVVKHIRMKVQKQDEIGTDPAARKDARIVEVEILLDDPEPAAALTNLQVNVVIGTG